MSFKEFKNTRYFKIISNKYVLIGFLFIVWMLFLDSNSWLIHRELNNELEQLDSNKEYYIKEITKDERLINILEDSLGLENFAREKYFMRKENEDVYIIEHKNNSNETE